MLRLVAETKIISDVW